jgi:hypothetical protein
MIGAGQRTLMVMPEENALRSWHFRQLRWSLQALAATGSNQRPLFPDHIVTADDLAFDFDHWAGVIRSNYERDLSRSQAESLGAIDQKLATMSRDGVEFDLELWTEAALHTSEHWADVRRLATSALEAFGWPVEGSAESPNDRGSVFGR